MLPGKNEVEKGLVGEVAVCLMDDRDWRPQIVTKVPVAEADSSLQCQLRDSRLTAYRPRPYGPGVWTLQLVHSTGGRFLNLNEVDFSIDDPLKMHRMGREVVQVDQVR